MKKILAILFAGAFITAGHAAIAMDLVSDTIHDYTYMSANQAYGRCGGKNVSPDLIWTHVPHAAKSLALVVHDADATHEHGFYHWIVIDIPTTVTGIAKGKRFVSPARELPTDFGETQYGGPCPPLRKGVHHYDFTVYALDVEKLRIDPKWSPHDVVTAIRSHMIGRATITGLYDRN
ncbi:MAG: YbhB/YbcL family Raf kinase inhibitor-like protein [Proteobacteria bacterium]|nr:YbhB/YbcL family Raf kinase inhibitor-like protein [Pseudomonadota bacterium]